MSIIKPYKIIIKIILKRRKKRAAGGSFSLRLPDIAMNSAVKGQHGLADDPGVIAQGRTDDPGPPGGIPGVILPVHNGPDGGKEPFALVADAAAHAEHLRLEDVDYGGDAAGQILHKAVEHLLCRVAHDVEEGAAPLMRRNNVIKNDLVGALPVVFRGAGDGVTDILHALEVDALDDLAVPDIEAGDNSFRKHTQSPFSMEIHANARLFDVSYNTGEQRQQPDNVPANAIEQMRTQSENTFVKEMAERRPTENTSAPGTNHAPANSPNVTQATPAADNNANVNAPQNPQNPQNVRDDYNVRQQIVEQARMIRSQESTEMVIRLRPEHLGELTLRVSVSANGAVNASFHTPNAEVRAIIENSLVQLKQELNNQGLKVEDVEVYAGLADGQLPGRDGQAWQQGRGQSADTGGKNPKIAAENFEETADATSPTNAGDDLAEGVDYRV